MERNWLIPAVVMTIALAGFVCVFAPDDASFTITLGIIPLWLLAGACVYLAALLVRVLHLMRLRHPSPLSALNIAASPIVVVGFVLAGLNMTAFMCAKPVLNILVPFWADPFLARLDRALFLGHDPGQLLSILNFDGLAIFYHRGWFVMLILALVHVLQMRSSRSKTALLITYFSLWTFVGPIIHFMLPAGGPIFYTQLTGMPYDVVSAPITTELATMLWGYYASASFGPGAGISAMPSLHIATSVWVCIAFYRTIWFWPVAAASFLIFLLSISLGWHYAVDGFVGGAACLIIWQRIRRGAGADATTEDAVVPPSPPRLRGDAEKGVEA